MTNYIDDEWNELKKKSLNQQYWLKFHKKKSALSKIIPTSVSPNQRRTFHSRHTRFPLDALFEYY